MNVYMFHYVTDNFKYYHFDKGQFEETIKKLIMSNNKIINLKVLKKLQEKNEIIDNNYVLLTFDDGTIDHYKYVFPILKKYNVPGVFFICSNIFHKNVLNIQLIHQIFNKIDIDEFYFEIQNYIFKNNLIYKPQEIVNINLNNWKEKYIKRLLQTSLPVEHTKKILEQLMNKYNISNDFNKYYMSVENMLEMKNNNMEFGCHASTHNRLSNLCPNDQLNEVKENMDLLIENKLITKKDILSIAYPFGDYNAKTIDILKSLNFEYAFTTKEESIYKINKYEMARYDCNILKRSKL